MRTFGLLLLVAGVAGFLYCSSQLSGADPMPAGVSLSDYLHTDPGRYELGRYASVAAALVGLLLAFFPSGR
jgi:hypothetical protein